MPDDSEFHSLFPVHVIRIKQDLPRFFKTHPRVDNFAIEATSMSGMARRTADLMHFQQDSVCIAVDVNRSDFLNISRLFPFGPEFFSRSTPVRRSPSFNSRS